MALPEPMSKVTKKGEFGIPWFLVVLLTIWGTVFGLLSDNFVKGFFVGILPPLVLGFGFAFYAVGMSYLIRRLGIDPKDGGVGIALFLSFICIVVPICIILARAAGLPVKW
ncbi:hypothetical protein [Lysobacter hankyongensis]|uniref:Uncharacterized protein n=1 Tax=Lysobacter hankyongensis TaxID=1176535 RepID=A0ABP9B6X1_9GAMM